jgi:flavin reductase (DIM6/NTAB) family NADH-FMN oxidoreductase RutF
MSDDAVRAGISRALSRLPSGLFVLTAGRGDSATGMLASFAQQVGFEPPTVIVALKKGRPIEALVRSEGAFCLAVIDERSKGLMGHFARGFEPSQPAFVGIDIGHSAHGVPFPKTALGHLECRVRGIVDDWTDHVVVCGEVLAGDARSEPPMVHVRKNGFSY